MKIFAALALAVAINAHAETMFVSKPQTICATLAHVGESAATSNSMGYEESLAKAMWADSVQRSVTDNAYADSITKVGYIEIRAVYSKDIVLPGEGYWTAYAACMETLK
jgi:hypothetical protein